MDEKQAKGQGASNVMVNVTVNVDPEVFSKVIVDVLKDATIMKNLGSEALQSLLAKVSVKAQ